ncbi:RNA dependent RNA polymerase-domain-containing protein [Paraphoma chrysanthemicola]|uniref:RNA-dependent RNA polymerase n=1 Tax=Paraphoma chrysanthemicola TaxID=798071 RepID=A0A8K0VSF0_9PLEO|nr:RNA dependent RNA polymerase-domain-containing protein [Paraphoma chrysanthemicola]
MQRRRRSPRLRDDARPAAGGSATLPAPVPHSLPQPTTPQHPRPGAVLSSLIRSLDDEWHLGLGKIPQLRSPAQHQSTADKTCANIQRLFFSARPALDDVIQTFAKVASGFPKEAQLDLLHGMLKSQTTQPPSRVGTPVSGSRNVPPKSLLSTSQVAQDSTFLTRARDDRDSHYTTAPEPGSSTDEDDFETPPSPTPSSRHMQASPRFLPTGPQFARTNTRKRPSESSEGSGSSPKLTRTKGKEPIGVHPYDGPSLFKKPSLDMARSFQAAATTTTSANTSFNASLSSSQQTRADTVNTSFTSYDGVTEDKLTRTSSTTLGSLDDQDLLYVGTKLESQLLESQRLVSQDGTRESTSTYGSIDEVELAATTSRLESSDTSMLASTFASVLYPALAGPALSRSLANPTDGLAPPRLDAAASILPPTKTESPSRLAYYIRDLPQQNLFVDPLADALHKFPFFISFICCRIAEAKSIPILELMRNLDLGQLDSPDHLWTRLESHPQMSRIALRDSKSVWFAAQKSFEGVTFKGKLVFNKSALAKTVFKLELQPLQLEMSCQLQRQYGADRFLYLSVPSFQMKDKPERFGYADMQAIRASFHSWLLKTHSFLGRLWRVFQIQPIKKKSDVGKDDTADMRLVLFAIEGVGIDGSLSIGAMLNGFIPFEVNKAQNYCKAQARIDLGLSKTTPTLCFKPSQIRRIRDTYSDGTPEATSFNDTRLSWTDAPPRQVMNDGCSRISVGAALQIWNQYRKITGSDDPFPSVMQGRIGGAKGVWMISAEPQTRRAEDLEIWIEITDSQLKFEPPWEDCADDRLFNKHRLTFNLLKYSHATRPTDLHISFIPIMVDRGVPRDVISKFMTDRLDEERQELLGMLSDPVSLHNWIAKQGAGDSNIRWQAALPLSVHDKVKLLLRSGFCPEQAPYLAYVLERFLRQRQTWMEQKLRAPLGKATFMYGIADPKGVLQPGEVHIQFSTPFNDPYTGISFRNLQSLEILSARQPACRASDIQKLRAVQHPGLSHLVDVVVFSSRGPFPLAGKLQGGDYDGDIFWICWEDCLVAPFQNAPAPLEPLNPARYGIKTDIRKLHQVMDTSDLSTVDGFLAEAFKFRTAPSLLGQATNFLEKLSYHQNAISSPQIDALCDVHDLLVDAAKQAYSFTEDGFNNLVRYKLKCGKLKKPAYKIAMEVSAKVKDNEGGRPVPNQKKPKHRPENILDYLFFDVFQAHNAETMDRVMARLSKEEDDDPDLQFPYRQLRNSANAQLQEELNNLIASFADIRDKWNGCFGSKPGMTSEMYCQALNSAYEPFRALLPRNTSDPTIAPLVRPYFGQGHPTMWETIRASALYCTYPKKYSFVWHMAGRELAHLKARALPETLDVVAPIFANMKPKPIKAPRPEDDDDEPSEDEFESALESIPG